MITFTLELQFEQPQWYESQYLFNKSTLSFHSYSTDFRIFILLISEIVHLQHLQLSEFRRLSKLYNNLDLASLTQ